MSAAVATLIENERPRAQRPDRVLLWSGAASVLLHALAGSVAITVLPGLTYLPARGVALARAAEPMLFVEPVPAEPPEPQKPPAEPPPPPPPPPVMPEQEKPREVRLGVDDAKAESETWMGSSRPGEHAARESTTEQPALTRDEPGAGVPAPAGAATPAAARGTDPPAPPASPDAASRSAEASKLALPEAAAPARVEHGGAPAGSAVAAPDDANVAPGMDAEPKRPPPSAEDHPRPDLPEAIVDGEQRAEPAVRPAQSQGEGGATADRVTAPVPEIEPSPAEAMVATQRFLAALLEALTQLPAPVQAPAAPPQEAPQPGRPVTPGAGGAGAKPTQPNAQVGERVSDSTSRRHSAVYRDGEVSAGKGLELIVTRRPESTTYTRLRGAERNPVFDIVFDRDGVPRDVLCVQSSGNSWLDGDITSAIYFWRARGKDLSELPARPGATLTVRLGFILFRD